MASGIGHHGSVIKTDKIRGQLPGFLADRYMAACDILVGLLIMGNFIRHDMPGRDRQNPPGLPKSLEMHWAGAAIQQTAENCHMEDKPVQTH